MTNVLSADNSKWRPATVATFIKRWGTAFNTAINNPSPWDYIGAGSGVTFSALAKAMAAEGTAARLMDINVSNIGMVPSIAQSCAKNGASGAMAELGAGAVALLAGWGTDTTVTAADDSAIIDNDSTDGNSAGSDWHSSDDNSDGDTYNDINGAYNDN